MKLALKAGVFFSPETISRVDDMKIKSKVSAFFPPLHVHLPFITLLSLLFARLLTGPKEGLKGH